jgi:SAM-dependent methyltransferase
MIPSQIVSLPSNTDVLTEFPQWVVQHCNHTSVVLDIGAGQGKSGNPAMIRQKVGYLVGVDPDSSIEQNPYLHECHRSSLEDFAKNRGANFDCLYSMFVMEHITRPYEFLSSCRTLLKPGGMLFGMTPNLWHYFGITTKLSLSLGIEDWLLDRVMGKQVKASYHFPTAYHLNSIRTISRTLEQTGFSEVEFRCVDQTNRFETYFPKLLRWFPGLYSPLVYRLRIPHIMGLIMFRARG